MNCDEFVRQVKQMRQRQREYHACAGDDAKRIARQEARKLERVVDLAIVALEEGEGLFTEDYSKIARL